jgi:hypothetical protein
MNYHVTDTGDPYYDVKQHQAWPPSAPAIVIRKVPFETRANQRRNKHFVKVPWVWVKQLAKARWAATTTVARFILHKNFETHGKPFILANGVLEQEMGVSRGQKWRALAELEQFGLIAIERRRRKSPVITVRGVRQS